MSNTRRALPAFSQLNCARIPIVFLSCYGWGICQSLCCCVVTWHPAAVVVTASA